ncbi:The BURPS668_1122 family of deaminases [Pseudomonas sp. NFACC43]|nr:The BURPS668_1122 family of deaminases [Pseudomonas sp. NFACC47-1]SFX22292.1 The BURPS668_1122 family of deaminases [Pseudomonas sp. NFACC43]
MHPLPSFDLSMNSPQHQWPSQAQAHQGLLAEYDALLALVRNNETPTDKFIDRLLTPQPCSPMALENAIGQQALRALMENKDYQSLCATLDASFNELTVILKDGQAHYFARKKNDTTVIRLELDKQTAWKELLANIEKSALRLAGKIRFDGQFSLARMTRFYGIAAWDPQDAQQRQATLDTLEEKRARHSLGLWHGIRLDEPNLEPTPAQAMDDRLVIETVRQFLPTPQTSLLDYLGARDITRLATQTLRAKPSMYLEQILLSPRAQALAARLLLALDWFGGRDGENSAPGIRTGLLVKALRLWITSVPTADPEGIAGYRWQKSAHWGKSYQEIQAGFEAHLVASGRATSVNESILIAGLFLPLFPLEFQVRDIPPQLPYRSSTVWVNFVHGVHLAQAIDPLLLQRLDFQQLVDLPIRQAIGATAEELKLITLTRLKPMLEWALTNGLIGYREDANYPAQDIQEAAKRLDSEVESLNRAIRWLDSPPPERLNIARAKMARFFGESLFVSDGRKLVKEANAFYTAPQLRLMAPIGRPAPDAYSFVDVYASGQLQGKRWFITGPDGKYSTSAWLSIDDDRTVQSNLPWPDLSAIALERRTLPDIEETFATHFKIYLNLIRNAYRTLIAHQLASLPLADRHALEYGSVKVYTLRQAIMGTEAANESEDKKRPLRARNGFVLAATRDSRTSYYEVLPRAGVIRRRPDITEQHLGGELKTEKWRVSRGSSVNASVVRTKILPFDWDAHVKGTIPAADRQCQAILDQLGDTLEPMERDDDSALPRTLESKVTQRITQHIAQHLLFVDEKELHDSCYGATEFDHEKAKRKKVIDLTKMLVPFWSSIEDLSSGDRDRLVSGAFGLFIDFASFVLPIGKFASGSLKLIRTVGKWNFGETLPAFAKLTGTLLNATLNPLDAIPSLFQAGGQSAYRLGKKGYFNLKVLSGRAGHYDFVKGMSQATDPGRWRPLANHDQLGAVRGVDDVLVRNVGASGKTDYRLIDPFSDKPYGPSLSKDVPELSLGRSHYNTLARTDTDVIVEVPQRSHIREQLEVDGSRTLYLDDVPYRLADGTLRRASQLDASETLRKQPCRVRRAPDEICKTRYVLQDKPAERPPSGEFSAEPSWAPWFGDTTLYPSIPKSANDRALLAFEGKIYELKGGKLNTYKGRPEWIGLTSKTPIPRETVDATLEFQTGLYGGIRVSGTAEGIDDTHVTGALIIRSIDEKFNYVFTRLNFDDYYMTRLPSTDSLEGPLILKKLGPEDLMPGTPGEELQRVYIGSLNANNAARIYGRDQVELALDKIDEISIPIGAPVHPPSNMKWVKVNTYSAEAVLFDRRTRMIVADLPTGAAVWKPSRQAPEALQKSTANIFEALFTDPSIAVAPQSATRPVTIDDAMRELQKILPTQNPKNIAFASVTTASGKNEVYVSVSGIEDYTRHLPLFKSSNGLSEITLNDVSYFNVDAIRNPIDPAALSLSPDGKLLAIPHLMDATGSSGSDRLGRITTADSESKLIGYISEKYPDPGDIKSITVATTLPPCESCSIVMKEFGHERGADALNVIWGQRRKRPATELGTSTDSD